MIQWEMTVQGTSGKIGKYTAFRIFYDGFTSKTEPKKYRLMCKLFGMKDDLDLYLTEMDARIKAEAVFNLWLTNTGLTQRGDHVRLLFQE